MTFIDAMADGASPRIAAQIAGYADPGVKGWHVLKRPGVTEAILELHQERIVKEGLQVAIDCLISIAKDPKSPAGARVQASKVLLDKGMPERREGQAKEPHEMSQEELQQAITRLQARRAELAKPIIEGTATPESSVFE